MSLDEASSAIKRPLFLVGLLLFFRSCRGRSMLFLHLAAAATTARRFVSAATALATTALMTTAAALATAAAAIASEPESVRGARNGQHGHHQSNTMKVHLPISNVYTLSCRRRRQL